MIYHDTITKALLLKHAVAAGKDPFSADYTQGDMSPTAAPPGSMEAKRQEQMEGATAEAEAQAQQQEAELKQQQKAVADAQKAQDKLTQDHQKTQQELMAARAEVDAFKARDSASSPGLSPSYNATQKRMQEKVKALGNATRAYNGALTLNKAAETMAKMAWWKGHFKQPHYAQIAELVKFADSMNPAPIAPQPKTVRGAGAIKEPRVANVDVAQAPVGPTGVTAPTAPTPPPKAPIKDPSAFKGNATTTASTQWANQLGGSKGMDDAQRAQYKDMLAQETAAAKDQGGWWNSTVGAAKDLFGTSEGRGEIKDEYQRFRQDPHQYMNDNSAFFGDQGFENALNRKYGEGSLAANGWRGSLARGMDWGKSLFTRPANQVAGGITQVGMGAADAVNSSSAAAAAKKKFMAENGLYGKTSDLEAAMAAARKPYENNGPGVGTGLKNVGLGVLGSAANVFGGGGIAGAGLKAIGKGVGLGVGYGVADGLFGGSPAEAGAPPATPSPATPAGPGGNTLTPESMRGVFAGAGNNPGFAQNINDYSGWANQGAFPSAMAGQYGAGGNSTLGLITNALTGMFGAPNYNSFMQGQGAFRNAGSPQFDSMNNAMSAFGRNMGYPQQMISPAQNRTPALSSYGY